MNIRQRLLAAGLSLLATGILLPVPGAARLPERARPEATESANGATDAVLCYGGSHHRTPYLWDEERLTPYVTCTDSAGIERWLFDGFIFLEFQDTNRPDGRLYTYETGHLRDMGFAAGKEHLARLDNPQPIPNAAILVCDWDGEHLTPVELIDPAEGQGIC